MERVQEIHSNTHAADTALTELCRLYIKGAEVEWEALYAGSRRNRVSLPPYPLERLRYWASPNVVEFHGYALEHKKNILWCIEESPSFRIEMCMRPDSL